MFRVSGYLDLANGNPGLLVPVFSKDGTNTPFVQSMDELYRIEEFFPYYQYDNFDFISEDRPIYGAVGKDGLIAFRSVAGSICCGDVSQAVQYLNLHTADLEERPLLKLQLLRISCAPLAQQYETWRFASEKYFRGARQRAHWLDAELLSFQSNEKIWSRIKSKMASKSREQTVLADKVDLVDPEQILELLSDPQSYERPGWDVLWFNLKDKLPTDERIYFLANDWLYALFGSNLEAGKTKRVFAEALRFWRNRPNKSDIDQFGEFLLENIRSGELFSDDLGLSFASLAAAIEICGTWMSEEEYIALLLQVLAKHYFSAEQTIALLNHIDLYAEPTRVLAADLWPAYAGRGDEFVVFEYWKDAAAKNQGALRSILDRLYLLDEKEAAVRAFRKKWKPLLSAAEEDNMSDDSQAE